MRAFYRRTGDASVPFCNKGGTTAHVTGFSVKKNRNKAKSVPMWVQGRDLNPRPPGYHFVPVAVVCRKPSPVRLCSLALWATPLSKTIHRIVFDSLTQRATLIGLITRYIKRRTDMVRHNVAFVFIIDAGTFLLVLPDSVWLFASSFNYDEFAVIKTPILPPLAHIIIE